MKKLILLIISFLIVGATFAQEIPTVETVIEDTVYTVVDEKAKFVGGDEGLIKHLSQTITYPIGFRYAGIEGVVIAQFIVEKDGSITNTEIFKSLAEDIDNIVFNIVTFMPDWEPATVNGETVRMKMKLPIKFVLKREVKSEDIVY